MREVLEGRNPLSPKLVGALVEAVRCGPAAHTAGPYVALDSTALTDREREVLDLLAQGLSNAAIATELSLSEAAVKSRLTQLTAKFGVRSRVQLLVRACELGIAVPRLRAE